MPLPPEAPHKTGDALHGFAKGFRVSDLRPDVHADSRGLKVVRDGAVAIEFPGIAHRHAELVLVQARRNVRVRARIHVGIHPYCEARPLAKMSGAGP